MTFQANTRADVFRADSTDADPANGDENDMGDVVLPPAGAADTDSAVIKNEPFSLIERTRRIELPETGELRTVRYGIGRCKGTLDVRQGDRIRDRTTGAIWHVNEKSGGGRSIAGLSDLVLDLRDT